VSALGAVDHVGYLARDLDAAVAQLSAIMGLAVARRFERPEFALAGAYLGDGAPSIEVFTFTEPELLTARLRGAALVLDHVAHLVADIDAVAASMRRAGVRFSGPDLRGELAAPVTLGGVRHHWSIPQTSAGQSIQLVERPSAQAPLAGAATFS
jgi:catechol 2,3-dioxygenase-like lactoylglutathione lyase family enzyme